MIFVALLRGINVGGNKKVEMSRLKSSFEKMGYRSVRTYINSGNVIFEADDADFSAVEKHLEAEFGFFIPVIFRTRENILELVSEIDPDWKNDHEKRTEVMFLAPAYERPESLELARKHPEYDHVEYRHGAIIWHIDRQYYSKSKLHDITTSELYPNMTARNINTVRKLAHMMSGDS